MPCYFIKVDRISQVAPLYLGAPEPYQPGSLVYFGIDVPEIWWKIRWCLSMYFLILHFGRLHTV